MSFPEGTAAAKGLRSCAICSTLMTPAQAKRSRRCRVCGASVSLRTPYSIQKTMAFLITSCVLYIPANFLPIMETVSLGRTIQSTIIQGVVQLWQLGSYGVALVIFVASVVVPILKMISISWLSWMVVREKPISHAQANQIYNLTEFVGKWSMVDVFVVALLVALIQFDNIMSIHPGPGALSFAGVVLFTMLSAQAFDVRLLWDKERFQESTLNTSAAKDSVSPSDTGRGHKRENL
ncbi:MAG: paraquat-inducible protein A [Cellvibrionaceae bacterium]